MSDNPQAWVDHDYQLRERTPTTCCPKCGQGMILRHYCLPPEPDITGWDSLRAVIKFPDKCHAEVTRSGEAQPCDKAAVAVVDDSAEYGQGAWWPVCARHARGRTLVPLEVLIKALNWQHYTPRWGLGVIQ